MLKAAKISLETTKKSILLFALINCTMYVLLMLAFKYLNLLHIWGLRMANYGVLALVCILQIRRWVRQTGRYVPFLQAFCTALFTSALSFIFFGAFILAYSFFDPYLAPLYITDPGPQGALTPSLVVIFEGTGAGIIIALIVMLYASRFEEGEQLS